MKKGVLLFQCEEHQNNQVFHENCDAAQAVSVLCGYMEKFRQMQMETKTVKYTVLVSEKREGDDSEKAADWLCKRSGSFS